jgi:DNA polymerase III delta subunit
MSGTSNMEITTIKLEKTTKERLDHLKEYKRETYEEIVQKILEILNLCRASPLMARRRLVAIDRKKRGQNKQPRIQKRVININQRPL